MCTNKHEAREKQNIPQLLKNTAAKKRSKYGVLPEEPLAVTSHSDPQILLLKQACFVANKRTETLEWAEGGCRSIINGDDDWKKSLSEMVCPLLSISSVLLMISHKWKLTSFKWVLKMLPNAQFQCRNGTEMASFAKITCFFCFNFELPYLTGVSTAWK